MMVYDMPLHIYTFQQQHVFQEHLLKVLRRHTKTENFFSKVLVKNENIFLDEMVF